MSSFALLHSALYSGTLNWALRKEIPYVPHITVAACTDFSECEGLARRLTDNRRDTCGSVEELAVLEIAEARAATVVTVPLRDRR